MSGTRIPGIKAQHAMITDQCRVNRGDIGAIDEALARLRVAAINCLPGWPTDQGVNFHLVLTVERPAKDPA